MNNVYEFPQRDKSFDEASQWCARMDKGLSAAEEQELQQWMAENDTNRQVLFEMTRLWDGMSVMSRLADIIPEPATRSRHVPTPVFAVAASVLAVVMGSWLYSAQDRVDQGLDAESTANHVAALPESVYETRIGEQSTVALVDGTQVVLNTNSKLEVHFTDEYRLLLLDRGEIHVSVAHDTNRPLSVVADDRILQAVGTAFSVAITDDQKIELVVTEGKVLVGAREKSSITNSGSIPPVLESTSLAVMAGEEIVLGNLVEDVVQVSTEEIEIKLSWRDGDLIFRGETLEEAVLEIGRYTTTEFVIVDDELKAKRIAGRFKAGDIEGLLAALRENFDVVYERTGDGQVFLAKM
ncbi:MAG: FecR domain-containing protein [Gammaproteobacteria bacterium]|nr:FecR domain-containing protein [Gammaproteobacteria bacterium]